ncbi:Leucine-rich repeat protein kinase family protein [Rhynchospora pubera]|uniref:Leucine-rich repeat protein kinase family protein n=1 Tax=Rhynchospora pubera TaxID=906938 RepID=A0AAV8C4R9_9POAL|nr:Leucine-rich repeat protein kinase family protein [Rhynchospora pubera]
MPLLPFFLLLWLLSTSFSSLSIALPLPRGYYINCGSTEDITLGDIKWIRDEGFIKTGNISSINSTDLIPILSSVRYFPDTSARKYCYSIPVIKGGKYMIRTTYYYGRFDGGTEPPVFDQIIEGTRWSTVNTTDDFSKGLSTYYEIIVAAHSKTLSVCLARNSATVSSPFISALELVNLDDSMYNSTNFMSYALTTIARNGFGQNGSIISYPDDPYNRYWAPFTDGNPTADCHARISSSNFWNYPPAVALRSAITTSRGKQLTIQWPPTSLPNGTYYVALYFQDNRTPSPWSWRLVDVSINGIEFFKGLNVSTEGVMIYASQLQLLGTTQIALNPDENASVGPMINAGEILQVVPLGPKTTTRDVIAMEDFARSLTNPPSDWNGDPCSPHGNSWTGVVCSVSENRVESLNLTNAGLSGFLPTEIANMTALQHIQLSGNNLSGHIPDMSNLKNLATLHLDNNQFTGSIPSSLGGLENLKELFLQNNKLSGKIPDNLKNKPGLNMQTSGNNLEP